MRKKKVDELSLEEVDVNLEEENHDDIENFETDLDTFKEEKIKTKKNGKWVNIISNIFFIPVLIILVMYLIYAISVQKSNGVPSFFGQSYVRVLSGSMRKSGFEKGDVVVIERVKLSKITAVDSEGKGGSIIAFYASSLRANSTDSKSTLTTIKTSNVKNFQTGQKTHESAIMFHQVINVYYDTVGNTWFETKGTSNASADTTLVRGDYVIGQYVDSSMADVIEFISSTKGMIILIIAPSAILLFMLLLNIIEIIDQMMREKKERSAILGDVKERELEVTTIIEEETKVEQEKKTRRRRATQTEKKDDIVSTEEETK